MITAVPRGHFIVTVILLLLPTAVYWNTISHRYGFRDDYSILRETREEPGKITRVCAAQARPLFGLMLEHSFSRLKGVDDLRWMRLASALLVGVLAALFYLVLRHQQWDETVSALLAAAICFLPGAQVLVSWAVSWPPVLAFSIALGGFVAAERAFGRGRELPHLGWWIAGAASVAMSALIYQASSLFSVVLLASGLSRRLGSPIRETIVWLFRHLATIAIGLGAAFAGMMVVFSRGELIPSSRVAFAGDLTDTLEWFRRVPLQNALALFALDEALGSAVIHAAAVTLVVGLLVAGSAVVWRRRGMARAWLWIAAFGLFSLLAYGVNLLSTERLATYRTMIPLMGVILIFLVAGLQELAGPRVMRIMLAVLVLTAGGLARRQAFDLIARPQGLELSLIEAEATRVRPNGYTRVFIITPSPAEAPSRAMFADEFGSLSSDSDWAAKEMLAVAVRRFFGDVRGRYTCESGRVLRGAREDYDVVIDLRRLREFRPAENPPAENSVVPSFRL